MTTKLIASKTTKEDILEKGLQLFSKYGFDGTTTRMMSQTCGVSVSTISFYFGNKEQYYHAVMNYAAEIIKDRSEEFHQKLNHYINTNNFSKKESWQLIDEFLDLLLSILRFPDEKPIQLLLLREQTNPPQNEYPVMMMVCERLEKNLIRLIQTLNSDICNDKIALCSRLLIGSIISQTEHPLFLCWTMGLENEIGSYEEIIQDIKFFCKKNIKDLTENNILGKNISE